MGKQTPWPGIFLALKFPYLCKFIQAYTVSLYFVFFKELCDTVNLSYFRPFREIFACMK